MRIIGKTRKMAIIGENKHVKNCEKKGNNWENNQ